MKTTKKIGVWMDHSDAYVMVFNPGVIKTDMVFSKKVHSGNDHTLSESESLMHNKEQHQQAEFYKKISETIKNYDEVLLFGPTDAKVELHNILKDDHHFAKIKVETKQTDKMTENQQHAFVKDYFLEH